MAPGPFRSVVGLPVMRGDVAFTAALIGLAGCGAGEGRDAATSARLSPTPSSPASPRSASQSTTVAFVREATAGCRVTHPNGRTAPGESPNESFHGRHGLWTILPLDGVLRITTTRPVPPGETFGSISPYGALSTKFPSWGSRSAAAKLSIRGTRVDGRARPLRLTVGPGASANSPHFWPTRLRFARAGCWRVTAKSGRARLTFTLAVHRARD
jgi:hypothetical protein